MLRSFPSRALVGVLAVLLVSLVWGCEDTVDPTLGIEAPFSLYGYLDPTADQQAIRVVPIADRIDAPTEVIDAAVTSTDLETGAQVAWRDSLVRYADGTTGHVFVGAFTPRPGSRVRIEAVRSDGDRSTVEVTVPPLVEAAVGDAIRGPGEVTYPIRFSGAPRVLNGQLRLVVMGLPTAPEGEQRVLTVPLRLEPIETTPDQWAIELPFLTAIHQYMTAEGLIGAGVRLVTVTYVGFVANDAWDTPSDDPDVLVEPGTFSNVEGGLGFVGAGYFATATWVPSPTVQASAGFTVDGGPASYVRINEVQLGPGGWVEFYNPLLSDASLAGYSISNDALTPNLLSFPFGTVVPARGFFTVDIPFIVGPQEALGLYDDDGVQVQRFYTEIEVGLEMTYSAETFGSFPDGLAFRISQGPEIFMGPLVPTRNAPNELPGRPLVINEVYTEGANGWVEVSIQPGYDISSIEVMNSELGCRNYQAGRCLGAVSTSGAPFAIADEDPDRLLLPQASGAVYVLARYTSTSGPWADRPFYRFVDVYGYDGQTAGESVGRVPDGPSGGWTSGLTPTRAAPNRTTRLSL